MVKDYINPEFEVVEHLMTNGKVRYNIYVSTGSPERNLLTMSGYCTFSNQCKTFTYQKHELEPLMTLHKKLQFKNWLREVKEYATGAMTRPNNYAGEV